MFARYEGDRRTQYAHVFNPSTTFDLQASNERAKHIFLALGDINMHLEHWEDVLCGYTKTS